MSGENYAGPDPHGTGAEEHLRVVEHENRHGQWTETELHCPETGWSHAGDIEMWTHCPYCGAELESDE